MGFETQELFSVFHTETIQNFPFLRYCYKKYAKFGQKQDFLPLKIHQNAEHFSRFHR